MMNNTVPVEYLPPSFFKKAAEEAPQAPASPSPRLTAVPGVRGRPARKRHPLLTPITVISIILLTMVAELGISIANSQGAYDLRALSTEQRDLQRVERLVQQNVEKLSSPQNLSANAQQLGMVQNVQPGNLRLSDGAILGNLETKQTSIDSSMVPNSTLSDMPVVDAEGMLVSRDSTAGGSATPERWKGKLPVPETH